MKKLILILVITLQAFSLQASKGHLDEEKGHDHEETSKEESDSHDDHSDDEKKSGEDDGHGHADNGEAHDEEEGEEESSAVGPNKGITEKSKEGIKLSAAAWKLMGINTSRISNRVMEISYDSLVEIKSEKSIYRIRNSWMKRSPIKVLKKTGDKLLIEIEDFREGDLLVTSGVGFIRTAELVAEQGAASGHSH